MPQAQSLGVDDSQNSVSEPDAAGHQNQKETIQYTIASGHRIARDPAPDELSGRSKGNRAYNVDQFICAGVSPHTLVQLPQHKEKQCNCQIRKHNMLIAHPENRVDILNLKIVPNIKCQKRHKKDTQDIHHHQRNDSVRRYFQKIYVIILTCHGIYPFPINPFIQTYSRPCPIVSHYDVYHKEAVRRPYPVLFLSDLCIT